MEYKVELSGFDETTGFFVRRTMDVNSPLAEFAKEIALAVAGREGLRDAKVKGCWRREAYDVPVGRE